MPGFGILIWGGGFGTGDVTVVDNKIIDAGYGSKWGNDAYRNWAYPGVVVIANTDDVQSPIVLGNTRVHTGEPESKYTETAVRVVENGATVHDPVVASNSSEKVTP